MKDFATTLVILLAAVLPHHARAQNAENQTFPCLERGAAVKHLGSAYRESPVAMGLTNTGAVLEVLSTKKGDNWTIIVTMPDGTACLIAAGKDWEKVPHTAKLGPKA